MPSAGAAAGPRWHHGVGCRASVQTQSCVHTSRIALGAATSVGLQLNSPPTPTQPGTSWRRNTQASCLTLLISCTVFEKGDTSKRHHARPSTIERLSPSSSGSSSSSIMIVSSHGQQPRVVLVSSAQLLGKEHDLQACSTHTQQQQKGARVRLSGQAARAPDARTARSTLPPHTLPPHTGPTWLAYASGICSTSGALSPLPLLMMLPSSCSRFIRRPLNAARWA
jgi:hypothetical protein